ncbi:methylated-DNA--[protein]-cysteine S-methyltransferase [Geomonas sp. RF6]|uniref:methylated-DNA--[protein]-cysteine S-methyltransferase n=1 Tax=Geomonas sp. RF6 TaxID=2897342 RepID=UPI001E2B58D4|nr:methylated-DNA--[protein]-cysteine S-methyltransferase [Geomonas sp. RF6]UFS70637.1 methylated-DNA--[protein]-cysteine S-methyltransferase [Geomonas sp. RF6]
MIYTCTIETPLGAMTAAVQDDALTGLWFMGQKYYPTCAEKWICQEKHPVFRAVQLYLSRYFSGEACAHNFPLAPQGSPFQKAVWEALTRIPYGETVTYGAIAKEIAGCMGCATMSAQAVGGAVGHNPISIVIPCHRVLGANGKLTGYAGGVEKKEALLRLEAGSIGVRL